MNWNNIFFDLLGMIRSWVSTMGVFVLTSVAQYLIDNQTWEWKQLLIAAIVSGAKYLITHYDHAQAKQAVAKAALTGDVTANAITAAPDTTSGEQQQTKGV